MFTIIQLKTTEDREHTHTIIEKSQLPVLLY